MKCTKKYTCSVFYMVACLWTLNAQIGHEIKTQKDSMLLDGRWRTYEFHVPQYPTDKARLVFVFHDSNMNAKAIQKLTGFEFNKLADRTAGTLVVYPEAAGNVWNNCSNPIAGKLDDLKFVKSIIQRMERRYHIDRKNVFAVGYFKGGNFCYALANSIPENFKGFAVIGANLSPDSKCNNSPVNKPVSMMIINDLEDTRNLSYNQPDGNLDNSINESFRYWLKLLDTAERTTKPMITTIEKSNSSMIRLDYKYEDRFQRASLLKIVRGGYGFPNPMAKKWPQTGMDMHKQINIPEVIMNYFYQIQFQYPLDQNK